MSAPMVAGGPRVRTPAHQSVSRRGRCAHTHVMRACATPSGPQWAHGMVKGTCVEKCEGERHWSARDGREAIPRGSPDVGAPPGTLTSPSLLHVRAVVGSEATWPTKLFCQNRRRSRTARWQERSRSVSIVKTARSVVAGPRAGREALGCGRQVGERHWAAQP